VGAANFPALIARHRNCFLSGKTRPVEWREAQLDALHALMTERADDFFDAAVEAAVNDQMMQSERSAHRKERGIFPIGRQYPRRST
jgi:aldehyde dehydrogenase (NAD+)